MENKLQEKEENQRLDIVYFFRETIVVLLVPTEPRHAWTLTYLYVSDSKFFT